MHNIGELLPVWSIIPFVGMLLSIAIVPLVKPEWWEHNLLKVSILWSLLFLIPFGIAYGAKVLKPPGGRARAGGGHGDLATEERRLYVS